LALYALGRAGLDVAVERTDSASLARPARRPEYSVLSNLLFEHVTGMRMPHWQEAVDRHLRAAAGHSRQPAGQGER
jgi:dTDP-4-dehydrorhamnose reductase